MSEKPFKTIDDQIKILKDRNLIILNETAAKKTLQDYGYYEIINGYKYPFLKDSSNDDIGYKPLATFEHIFELYQLDSNIRSSVMSAIEIFENSFKQSLAYNISKYISDDFSVYSNKENYSPGDINQYGKSDRDFLLKKLNNVQALDIEPYKHYRTKYNNVPPWILVKGLSLGSSMYLFSLLKDKNIKEAVIGRMMGFDPSIISGLDDLFKIKQVFSDSLTLILDYRNLAAHGGRVYNHRSDKHQISVYSPLLYASSISRTKFKNGYSRSSINALLLCLAIMENNDPYTHLFTWLKVWIAQYIKKYPDDASYLKESMEIGNLDITDMK